MALMELHYIGANSRALYRRTLHWDPASGKRYVITGSPRPETHPSGSRWNTNLPTAQEEHQKVICRHLEYPECERYKPKVNKPVLTRCLNCETNYPTKYQYQRHQCAYDAEKVILKSNAEVPSTSSTKVVEENLKFDCNICSRQFVSLSNLERHKASHEDREKNVCEFCSKHFVSPNRLRIHKENHCKKSGEVSKFYRSDATVWKCTKCNQIFSSSNAANFHLSSCLSDDDNKENVNCIQKTSTETLLQCEFCNRIYANKEQLLVHQRTHRTDKNYECVICEVVFSSYITAAQHWSKKCSDKANWFYLPKLTYCEYCDRTFKSHELLYTHKVKKKHYTMKLHSKENNKDAKDALESDEITKMVEDVLNALENIDQAENQTTEEATTSTPTADQPQSSKVEKKKRGRKRKLPTINGQSTINAANGYKYQCERCNKVFDSIKGVDDHHDGEHPANYACDKCDQVLPNARALLVHSRVHQNLKPYVCETCGRSYSQTSHLWQHMRFHQGIKPFACPHEGCEARYTIRPDLKDHIRKVHTRERPFKCGVCGKCFLTGSVYYQHRLIHTDDRRYGCDICKRRFFRADALNNHKRIHTNERPYPCSVCGRYFRQKGDRNKHYRTQHPGAFVKEENPQAESSP